MKTFASPAYVRHIQWLRDLRKQQKVTQAQLAAKLGLKQSYVAKVEVLERRLDVLEYALWTRALDQDPSVTIQHLMHALESESVTGRVRRRLLGD